MGSFFYNEYAFLELQRGEFASGGGSLELYDFGLRQYDPQIGRWHAVDPKPNSQISPFAAMTNNPIVLLDPRGDTTYRFDMKGANLGMFDLAQKGVNGAIGQNKTYKDANGKDQNSFVSEMYFAFNDPELDSKQLKSLNIGDIGIVMISDENINFMVFTGAPYRAYNLNDAGQFLWGNAMKRLGFGYASAQFGSETNEFYSDAKADQRAIKSGFFHNVKTNRVQAGPFQDLPLESF